MHLPISYRRIAKLVLEDLLQKQNKEPRQPAGFSFVINILAATYLF
jgi:hypothetical protein